MRKGRHHSDNCIQTVGGGVVLLWASQLFTLVIDESQDHAGKQTYMSERADPRALTCACRWRSRASVLTCKGRWRSRAGGSPVWSWPPSCGTWGDLGCGSQWGQTRPCSPEEPWHTCRNITMETDAQFLSLQRTFISELLQVETEAGPSVVLHLTGGNGSNSVLHFLFDKPHSQK